MASPEARPARAADAHHPPQHKTPVTMLSGFLGAGKTTLLRHLLEHSTEKVACIVNDVASVNVDAKLVRGDRNRNAKKEKEAAAAAAAADGGAGGAEGADGDKALAKAAATNTTSDLADTIELANGCACCSLQDELFASFEQVLALADRRGEPYSRIVLENSGVAEPAAIRDQFAEAAAAGHPLLERLQLDTLVTVVDAAAFVRDYASRAPLAARPELGDGGSMRPVVDLLVEQVEVADYVILNKADMLPGGEGGDAMAQLRAIVSSLNPIASVESCERGRVPIERVFGRAAHGSRAAAAAAAAKGGDKRGDKGAAAQDDDADAGVGTGVLATLNVEGQHRGAVAAARAAEREEAEAEQAKRCKSGECAHEEHKHGHEGHGHEGHGHKHEHKHEGHKHEHKHEHHDHGHEDGHTKCDGTGDCGHDHHHHHDHHHDHHGHKHEHKHGHKHADKKETSAARRFGIRSFVYSRRAPFHPQRLRELVLRWLPVQENAALKPGATGGTGDGDGAGEAGAADAAAPPANPAAAITAATAASAAATDGGGAEAALRAVLRSKGFMWLSSSHETAYYWSHAGQHFEIRDEGDWWAAVPEEEWPEDEAQRAVVRGDFAADEQGGARVGDRRQEIVFIGVGMDREAIERQLDGALLTEEEQAKYWERWAPAEKAA